MYRNTFQDFYGRARPTRFEPTSVDSIYKRFDERQCHHAIGHMLVNFMTADEAIEILSREIKKDTSAKANAKFSEISKAQIILMFPEFEDVFPIEDFSSNILLALLFRDFDRFIGYIDINLLTREQIKIFLGAKDGKFLKYIIDNMIPERMQKIFTIEMWKRLLKRYPQKTKLIDITKIRNQTQLRHFILQRPSVLKYSTIDDMKNCVIDGPTWVRIVTQLTPAKRKYVPVGFKKWAERDIFTKMLKGKRFKSFKNWSEGLRDVS